jgi:hypothetical protein
MSWYAARVGNFADACKGLQRREKRFRQGLADLERHRRISKVTGSKSFNYCSWSSLRSTGKTSERAALDDLPHQLSAHVPMDASQYASFLDELQSLHVVRRVAKDAPKWMRASSRAFLDELQSLHDVRRVAKRGF